MGKKRRYVGEKLKWFMDFLPDEVFNSLSEEEQVNYREYRRYQRFIGEGNQKIEKYQRQIESLNKKIKKEKEKIKGIDTEHSSWEQKMKIHYYEINHLYKDFTFGVSITRRDRSSKSQKIKEGRIRKNVLDEDYGVEKNTYKGKEITKNYLWYSRVSTSKYKPSIYLGKEENLRLFLGELYDEDWSKDDIDTVKDELRSIISQYTRYKVFHTDWKTFDSETHNLQTIKEWCDKMGDKRYEWGGMKS